MPARRTIVIQRLEPVGRPFKRKGGGEGRVMRVHATTVEGVPIPQKLKTFATLPVGREIDVDVKPDNHPEYGESFIVSLPGGRTRERLDDHERRLTQLEERAGITAAS
jgi:hypothetical protein